MGQKRWAGLSLDLVFGHYCSCRKAEPSPGPWRTDGSATDWGWGLRRCGMRRGGEKRKEPAKARRDAYIPGQCQTKQKRGTFEKTPGIRVTQA